MSDQTILPALIIKAAQHACRMTPADIDGVLGPKTLAALREYDNECDDFALAMADQERLALTVAQHAAGLRGAALDGVLGPITERAVHAYAQDHRLSAGDDIRNAPRSSWAVWQPHESPRVYQKNGIDLRDGTLIASSSGLSPIPTRKQRDAVFGDALALGEAGMRSRMQTIKGLPGRFNKGTGTLPLVHEKIVPHVVLAFELFELFGVLDEIYKIWFFNYRHQRHDKTRPLSLHSWGIACDINAKENFAWTPRGAEQEIAPFSPQWWQKYPRGLSEIAVLCMKKAGFRWGGDWPRFRDPMHFELLA